MPTESFELPGDAYPTPARAVTATPLKNYDTYSLQRRLQGTCVSSQGEDHPTPQPPIKAQSAVREASSSGVILAAPPRAVVVSFAVVTPLLSPVPPPAAKSSDSSVSGGSSARLHGLYTGNGGGDPSGRLGAAPGGVSSATHVSSPGRSPAPAVGRNAGPEQYVVLSWVMLLSFQNLSFLSGSCESVYVFSEQGFMWV